jgi:hypothetical protein
MVLENRDFVKLPSSLKELSMHCIVKRHTCTLCNKFLLLVGKLSGTAKLFSFTNAMRKSILFYF